MGSFSSQCCGLAGVWILLCGYEQKVTGLEEEDLSIDSSTVDHKPFFSFLSESHCHAVEYTSIVQCDREYSFFYYRYYIVLTLSMWIHALLRDLIDWQSLGLELGMLYPTLGIIEKKRGVIDKCKTKMLAAWLQQQDNGTNKGVPVLDGVAYTYSSQKYWRKWAN